MRARGLGKTYSVPEREPGLRAALRSLWRRRVREVSAVDGISFEIAPGEVVGFLGPNGAGKTTTLKMLAGLLHPSAGQAEVLGWTPALRQPEFLQRITLVTGQRSQLNWDIPAADSFELHRAVYRIPPAEFRRTVAELDAMLDLGPLLSRPVRNLSLGERMKCEVAVSLLHRPQVLFLDEPTIGLDVVAQRRIRAFLADYNRRTGATVLLTSHYMADVEALCRRVIVIHQGRLLFDGQLEALVSRFRPYRTIVVRPSDPAADLRGYGEVVASEDGEVTLRVPRATAAAVTGRILADVAVLDLTVQDPPIEDVVEHVFTAPSLAEGPP
ncbi:MAG TPA: ATP-binding cassette domain-containing protein [Bacillota bacterium]|nr:ATP-binding cassette domain-containing protein [Bacillota bacterium]